MEHELTLFTTMLFSMLRGNTPLFRNVVLLSWNWPPEVPAGLFWALTRKGIVRAANRAATTSRFNVPDFMAFSLSFFTAYKLSYGINPPAISASPQSAPHSRRPPRAKTAPTRAPRARASLDPKMKPYPPLRRWRRPPGIQLHLRRSRCRPPRSPESSPPAP